ncbi:pyridoxal phosphate-dependent aminotransferase [Natronomonas salina]|uniref:pyridoxal phosphate-dependent aminotransferase n=1 Tax=Natronomonas salina TaxID=1710540 RepID=UPI0015B3CA1D|nr:pyridoxal phosphate-dependent aminotransferase [Natronomonas salina]QLD88654.1 pyridoxal phosphate-dependent aminotransferase [Natronomonas salina]
MNEYDRPVFFHLMAYADAADRDVVDMVSGNPDWEAPAALREGLREYADAPVDEFQYPPSEGLTELREEIAARRGVDVERVVVTNGAGEANYLAMACALRALDGDEVVLADPVYPYYYNRTEMLDATPRLVAAEPDGTLDADAVREVASDDTALIVINSPNNPTGGVYGRETKRELVAVAEEHDALLVSDEVYDHFVYEEGAFASALEFDSERTVVTNAFSKSMAITGFRVGYAVFPEWLVDDVRTRHMLVNVAGPRPSQYAVLEALRETPAEYYEENRRMLESRIDAFCDALDEAGAEYTRPQGSFYVMARFDGYPGTLENVERLIDEAGVAGMPGDAFGRSRADWLRFALVTPRAEEAAARLAEYFG